MSISTSTNSNGIEVSPGRYVNLATTHLSEERRTRQSIDQAMRQAKFTRNTTRCENLLLEAIHQARAYRQYPHQSYDGKKVTRHSFGTARPHDRDQEQIRMYLLATIYRCWMLGTGQKPKVNNRQNPPTSFVLFTKTIGSWFGLGNIVKNLERFQSYRRATIEAGLSYWEWRQNKPPRKKVKQITNTACNKVLVI